ncbi:unnamed protein product [Trichogramma brassicae]|uniref:Uncharacterized protein n=1 Tax=Trichogramma brassicae TaxID=86971 RepID=A0A6H5ICL9_9HYME|nr:unnamed protein product [Trichogramma brassicae]
MDLYARRTRPWRLRTSKCEDSGSGTSGRCRVSEVSERRMATRANPSRSDAYGLVRISCATFGFTETVRGLSSQLG